MGFELAIALLGALCALSFMIAYRANREFECFKELPSISPFSYGVPLRFDPRLIFLFSVPSALLTLFVATLCLSYFSVTNLSGAVIGSSLGIFAFQLLSIRSVRKWARSQH